MRGSGLFSAVAALLLALPVAADPASDALAALARDRDADGAIGAGGLGVLQTAEAVRAATELAPTDRSWDASRFHLLRARPGSMDLAARAAAAVCTDAGLRLAVSFGPDARALDGGLGVAPGAVRSSPHEAIQNLRTALACGASVLDVHVASHALVTLQRADGAFGVAEEAGSTELTALAAEALSEVVTSAEAATSRDLARGFLRTGLAGGAPSDPAILAQLVLALGPSDPLTPALLGELTGRQVGDGTFGTPRATALAARALGRGRSDLLVDPSPLQVSEAVEGLPIEALVRLQSAGAVAATARVRVSTEGGSVLAESASILVPAGGSALVPVTLPAQSRGPLALRLLVDPADEVPERDEHNNERAAILTVGAGVDLQLLTWDLSPEAPAAGEPFTIRVTVRNGGLRASASASVALDEAGLAVGAPAALASLAPGATTQLTLAVPGLDAGRHDLAARLTTSDPDDRADAAHTLAIPLDLRSRIDWVVAAQGFEISEPTPNEGETVVMRVHVRNAGSEAAPATVARFSDGAPAGGGSVIAELPVPPLAPGATFTVGPASWPTTGRAGEHSLHVAIDPDGLVAETNEQNSAVGRVEVIAVGDPAFVAGDVTITPAAPVQGDVVELMYRPRNLGTVYTPNFSFAATITVPDGRNQPVGTPVTTWAVAPLVASPTGFTAQLLVTEPGPYAFRAGLTILQVAANPQIDPSNDAVTVPFQVGPSPLPDLTVADGTFAIDPLAPIEGEAATLRARVVNRWGPDAIATVRAVARFADGSEQPIGEEIIAVGTATPVELAIPWDTTGLAAATSIRLLLDPDGVVAESVEDNNAAEMLLDLRAPGDLDPAGLTVVATGPETLQLDWIEGVGAPGAVRGYRIYRDGVWANPPAELAELATVTASASPAQAGLARDGLVTSAWIPSLAPVGTSWTATFPEQEIERVALSFFSNRVPTSYTIEARVAGVWQTIATSATSVPGVVDHPIAPLVCDGVRYVHGGGLVGLVEVSILAERLVDGATFTDGPLGDGAWSYEVRAERFGGGLSAPSNTAGLALGDVTAPSSPGPLAVTRNGSTIALRWTASAAADLRGYRVYRTRVNAAARGQRTLPIGEDATSTHLAFSGALPGNGIPSDGDGAEAETKLAALTEVVGAQVLLPQFVGTTSFVLESSADRVSWTVLMDRRAGVDSRATQYVAIDPPVVARYVRIREARNTHSSALEADVRLFSRTRLPIVPDNVSTPTLVTMAPLQRRTLNVNANPDRGRYLSFGLMEPGLRPAVTTDATTGRILGGFDVGMETVTTPLRSASAYRTLASAGTSGGTFRSYGVATPVALNILSTTDTVEFDGDYVWDVVAVDLAGNESVPSAAAPLLYEAVSSAPTNLRATTGDKTLRLMFSSNLAPTASYDGALIYTAGEVDPIAFTPTTAWDATGLVNRTQYCYEVAIRSSSGVVGPRAAPICATPFSDDFAVASRFGLPAVTSVPSQPVVGRAANVMVVVQQYGTDAGAPLVRLYDGAPEAGGVLLGETDVLVQAGGQAIAAFPWAPSSAGPHRLVAVVDPTGAFPELLETNNRTEVEVSVAPAPELEVRLSGVDASSFPEIRARLAARDTQGFPATGLSLSQLGVLEQGLSAQLLTLTERVVPDDVGRVDLVFVFDMSLSMADESTNVCAAIDEVATRLSARGVDLSVTRYGVNPSLTQETSGCLTLLSSGIYQGADLVNGIEDWGPATTWVALRQPWRAGARRIVVPVSDEAAFDGDPSADGDERSALEAAEACAASGVAAYPLYSEIAPGFVSPPVLAQMELIASRSGGVATPFPSAALLADLLVANVEREAADYELTFRSPLPARDGTTRGLVLSAVWQGLSGSGAGSYVAPLAPSDATIADGAASPQISPRDPTAGEAATLSARITNLGGSTATFAVRWLDAPLAAGGRPIGMDQLVEVAPGGVQLVETTWIASAGSHQIVVQLDPDGVVPEANEANNEATLPVLVTGTPGRNLRLSDVFVDAPSPLRTGAAFTVRATVTAERETFEGIDGVVYAVDAGGGRTALGAFAFERLASGASRSVEVALTAPGAGEWTLETRIDPLERTEQDRRNDDLVRTRLTVAGAELNVALITDRTSYPAGQDSLLRIELVNAQQGPVSGAVRVERVGADGSTTTVGLVPVADLGARPIAGLAFRLPLTVEPPRGAAIDALGRAEVDFTAVLTQLGRAGAVFAPESLRVFERGAGGEVLREVPVRFEPGSGFDPAMQAVGRVEFLMPGQTDSARSFEVVFDTAERGPFAVPENLPFPFTEGILAYWAGSGLMKSATLGSSQGPLAVRLVPDDSTQTKLTVGAGDFDEDGIPDVVSAGFPAGPEGLYRTHRGHLVDAEYQLDLGVAWNAIGPKIIDFLRQYQNFLPGDANRDGHLDFLVSEVGLELHLALGRGDGTFSLTKLDSPPGGLQRHFLLVDLDADGFDDAITQQNGPVLAPGLQTGGFGPPRNLNLGNGANGIGAADLDLDGDLDLVFASSQPAESVRVALAVAPGVLATSVVQPGMAQSPYWSMHLGDYDGDGLPDLITTRPLAPGDSASETLDFHKGRGDGTFEASVELLTETARLRQSVAYPARRRVPATLGAPSAGPGASYDVLIPLAGLAPGPWDLRATVELQDGTTAVSTTSIAIEPLLAPSLSVITLAPAYGGSEEASIRARLDADGSNTPLFGTIEVTAELPGGAVIFTELHDLGPLFPGTQLEALSTMALPNLAPGAYLVRARYLDATGQVLASAQGPLVVHADEGRTAVTAELSAPASVSAGAMLAGTASLTAIGNVDVPAAELQVQLVALDTGVAVATSSATVELLRGAAPTVTAFALSTAGLPLGDYLLVALVDGVSLASRPVELTFSGPTDPPRVAVSGVVSGELVAVDVTPVVSVEEADVSVVLLDGAPFVSGTTVTAEGDHLLLADATNAAGSTHVEVAFTIDRTPPALAFTGVVNGQVTCDVVLPGVTLEELHPGAAPSLTLDGQPWLPELPIFDAGPHSLTAEVTDRAGNVGSVTIQFVYDPAPPVVQVAGVVAGGLYGAPVTPTIAISDDWLDPGASFVTLDGVPFASGGLVGGEGDHLLVVHAVDQGCGITDVVVPFTIDLSPPELALTGVADSAIVGAEVVPIVSATDLHLATVSLLLDGAPWSSGSPISTEGPHTLFADALDGAGNRSTLSRSFTIDLTAPVITIAGVVDGSITQGPVTPTVTITELHRAASSVRLDGAPFVSGTPVSAEGLHTLVADAIDAAGNTATVTRSFTIDTTPPALSLTGVNEGDIAQGPVVVTATATDLHLATVTLTLDGTPWSSGAAITGEGPHTVQAEAVDAAGNRSTEARSFTIDDTAPVLSLGGVAEGEVTQGPVVPTLVAFDLHLASSSLRLDGTAWTSGQPISTEGPHTLTAEATDAAGNTTTEARSFTIDTTPPVLALSGVAEGAVVPGPVVPVVTATDLHLTTVTLLLDGAPWSSGSAISTEGPHTLQAEALDAAGIRTTELRHFTIDRTGPLVTISGATEGAITRGPVVPVVTVNDANVLSTLVTLDGAPWTSGQPVASEGAHTVTATATDAAGNVATASLHFTIDDTPPTLSLTGVAEGAVVTVPVVPVVSATDLHLTTLTLQLDGAPWSSGAPVATEGPHTLHAEAVDAAGNRSTEARSFTIDTTPPVIAVTGVVDGGSYEGQASPVVTATDATAVTLVLTLDGAAYVSGTPVRGVGFHVLEAMATDAAGNVTTVTIGFDVTAAPAASGPAVCGLREVSLQNSARVTSAAGVAAVGSERDLTLRNDTVISGDVLVGDDLDARNNARVTGTAYVADQLTLRNRASVGARAALPAPVDCVGGLDVDALVASASVVNDNALVPELATGTLERTRGEVVLPAGRYFVRDVRLRKSARVVAAPGAVVELVVEGEVVLDHDAFLGAADGVPSHLLVYVGGVGHCERDRGWHGEGRDDDREHHSYDDDHDLRGGCHDDDECEDGQEIELSQRARFVGELYGPTLVVKVTERASVTGRLVGESIELTNDARVTGGVAP